MATFPEKTFDTYLATLNDFCIAYDGDDVAAREWAFVDLALALRELYTSKVFTKQIDWSTGVMNGQDVFSEFGYDALKYGVLDSNSVYGINTRYEDASEPEDSAIVVSVDKGDWRPLIIFDDMGVRTTCAMLSVDARKLSRYVVGRYNTSQFGDSRESVEAKASRIAKLDDLKKHRDDILPEDLVVLQARQAQGQVASDEVMAEAKAAREAAEASK